MDNHIPTPSEIIDALGGTGAVAELCRISDAAVSQWREAGIPEYRMMYLRLARPLVFSELEGKKNPRTGRG